MASLSAVGELDQFASLHFGRRLDRSIHGIWIHLTIGALLPALANCYVTPIWCGREGKENLHSHFSGLAAKMAVNYD